MVDEASIQLRYRALCPVLDERGRRLFAAAEAKSAGRGGVAAVARITGIARSTIIRGLAEIIAGSVDNPAAAVPATRVRRAGGGRKKLTQTDPTLLADLQELVAAATRGDPQAPLLWTSRSLRNLAAALQAMGHRISHHAVADLLRELNYSLQSNRKTREGTHNPDRDAQFVYINAKVAAALAAGEPAISVDTKKKDWSATSRTQAANCAPKANQNRCAFMISRYPNLGAPHRMGYMTSPATPVGSAWASITTRQASPFMPSDAGGRPWEASDTPTHAAC